MIDIKVYNARQIGGCFTVITTSKAKIMIDYGLPLPGAKQEQEDFDWKNDTVDAVFITHYHGDHVGKIVDIPAPIPIYMGSATKEIMLNIHKALIRVPEFKEEQKKWLELLKSNRIKEVEENMPITDIDGIIVTPYSVDHSAYDAYMYLVEGDGKVILHTGDFRGHGYRGSKMLEVIKYYVHRNGRKVDYLITEGTMMGDRKDENVIKESQLYEEACKIFKEYRYVFLVISSTNLDSLSSFYQAARHNEMYMYCYNYYFYKQLKTFSKTAGRRSKRYIFKDIYTVDFQKQFSHELWDKDKTQEELMREHGFLCVIKADSRYNEWIEKFKDKNPLVIYSMWDGYIDKDKGKDAYKQEWYDFFRPYQESKQFRDLHTSGHATVKMIEDVIQAVDPQEEIIPMHTENVEAFKELIIKDKYTKIIRTGERKMMGMKVYEKTREDWDCRAIPQGFLEKFYENGNYYPFVELVKKDKELQLCFRGNDYKDNPATGGKVCIYRNNHAMFTLTSKKLYFNPNYLRYCNEWQQILEVLTNEYGFGNGKKIELVVKKEERYSCSFSVNQISVTITSDLLNKIEKLYQLLSGVFDEFFSNSEETCVDRFLEWSNINNKVYAGTIPSEDYVNNKKRKLEKIRQQQLFSSKELQIQKDGYYFYDMEFQQKHRNKKEQEEAKKRGESNKPDMQAIRFGKDGKPEALVFVEVKCTKSAYDGDASGLNKHIEAMRNYPEKNLNLRRREAYLLLHQYEQLGLRNFERQIEWEEYKQLPLEILLIFTDEAKVIWREDKTSEIEQIKNREENKKDREVLLPDGERALLILA